MMEQLQEKVVQLPEETAAPEAQAAEVPTTLKKKKKKKNRKKLIRRIVLLLILAALGFGLFRFFGRSKKGSEKTAATDFVQYGSITASVDGSGLTKAKNSETITLTTAGTVMDVFVTEGETVEEGAPLFTVNSPGAETAVQKARQSVQDSRKKLSEAYKNIAKLTLTAPYAGKLINTAALTVGEEGGGSVATLVDDSQMRLTQYFSYAYENDLSVGQKVTVSIPSLLSAVEGTVEAIHKVSRITEEGSRLFSVDILIPNAGVLTEDMAAGATVELPGETVYPYESGKLSYCRSTDLTVPFGTVLYSALLDYLPVTEGQLLVQIDSESSEVEIIDLEDALEEAEKKLEEEEKNLANCSALAPISGKVIGLALIPGEEIPANTAALTISDTGTVTVNATVDERNISYVKVGTMVNLDQWGTYAMGTVESISLSSSVSNGVATYPIVISADNSEGQIQINSYINYNFTASQSDNCLLLPIQAVRTVGLEDGSMATVVYIRADEMPENAVSVPYADEEIPEGFYPVPVEIGIQDNYNVEIKSGVSEGDEVFTQMMSSEVWG